MRTIPLEPNVTEPAPEGAYMTGAGTRNTSEPRRENMRGLTKSRRECGRGPARL